MKHAKRAPIPARQSGFRSQEVGPALKSMAQMRTGKRMKITLQVIWNDSEASRHKIIEDIRTKGLKFGVANDDRAFTFDVDSDASEFESLVGQLTNQKASVHRV